MMSIWPRNPGLKIQQAVIPAQAGIQNGDASFPTAQE
jgi:hypothetical protein